jgi:hypothetical protein
LQTCRQDQFYLFFFLFLHRLHLFFFCPDNEGATRRHPPLPPLQSL